MCICYRRLGDTWGYVWVCICVFGEVKGKGVVLWHLGKGGYDDAKWYRQLSMAIFLFIKSYGKISCFRIIT